MIPIRRDAAPITMSDQILSLKPSSSSPTKTIVGVIGSSSNDTSCHSAHIWPLPNAHSLLDSEDWDQFLITRFPNASTGPSTASLPVLSTGLRRLVYFGALAAAVGECWTAPAVKG